MVKKDTRIYKEVNGCRLQADIYAVHSSEPEHPGDNLFLWLRRYFGRLVLEAE